MHSVRVNPILRVPVIAGAGAVEHCYEASHLRLTRGDLPKEVFARCTKFGAFFYVFTPLGLALQ